MSTGACGIDCAVCGLKVKGICGGCDAGTRTSPAGDCPCPVLRCAAARRVAYCMRDCSEFPCNTMGKSAFPFSAAYLAMHRERAK